jgi:hypothetical protein
MAKKTKKTETTAQPPAVILREGKWVTADGLCFNTATKAWNHVREMEAENTTPTEPEQNTTQNE